MTVLVTVVSTSVLQRAIIDSGSKILSAGQLLSGDRRGYGYVAGHPELMVDGLSEEHRHLSIPLGCTVKIGDCLRITPNHVCTCINLHDHAFVVDGERVIDEWKVAARGRVA